MSNPFALLRSHESKPRMILWPLILLLILAPTAGQTRTAAHRSGVSAQRARVVEDYGKLPLAFEANQGQTDSQVKFLSRGAGYNLFLTSTEAVLTLGKGSREEPGATAAKSSPMKNPPVQQEKPSVLRMKLLGASAQVQVTGQDELPGKSNYFLGNDPKKWHANVPQYAKVRYANIYPGVDLMYYGNQRELEYDFVVQPGADPNVIRLGIEGAQKLRLEQGDLVLTSAAGDVHLRRPHIYQQANGTRQEVRGRYVITTNKEVRFTVVAYDRHRVLTIDPVLAYSTYLGGSCCESGSGIAVDSEGNAYVTGTTRSTDFPTLSAVQPTYAGNGDAFVTKFNADGSALLFSTYVGGSGDDAGGGIAVDSSGDAYVTGSTASTDFPTANAIQPTSQGGYDAFATKINAAGNTLIYSTYLGGSGDDQGAGIAADTAGNAYVTGSTWSIDLPTANAIQPAYGGNGDAFVSKINPAGSAFIFSTYLGGSSKDHPGGIALDTARNVYVAGGTTSTDFPIANAIQPTNHSGFQYSPYNAFVTKMTASGSAFIYSTYLGGSVIDQAAGIAVDAAGNAYVTGNTESKDFPQRNALQSYNKDPYWGRRYAFITKLTADGSALIYSTYLGGRVDDYGAGIAVDASGNAYVTGGTDSADFPAWNAFQPKRGGWEWYDAFITKLAANGRGFYSSCLGGGSGAVGAGIAVDAAGMPYVTGSAGPSNFPTTAGAFQPIKTTDAAFVSKIAEQTSVSISTHQRSFNTRLVGTTSPQKELTLTNNGPSTLTMNKVYIAGINASDFAESDTCGSSLGAGTSCTIAVAFTPSGKNLRTAALVISDSDLASPQAARLSGVATVVLRSKNALFFDSQAVGSTSAPKSATLTNTGTTPLNFSGIALTGLNPGDFSQTNTCGISIAPGAQCTITMTFNPTALGTRKAAVSIYDDGGASPQKIGLTGTGI